MKIPVIKIGNSKGIRLSKTILEKYEIRDEVELTLQENTILIKALTKPRQGWESQFRQMHNTKDDLLLMEDVFEDEALEEWK